MQTIIEELKDLQIKQTAALREERTKLKLREEAERVIGAIRTKSTNSVSGKDMAMFLEVIKSEKLFINTNDIEEKIQRANTRTEKLLKEVRSLIGQFKQFKERSNYDININILDKNVKVTGDYFTVEAEKTETHYPVFLKEPL